MLFEFILPRSTIDVELLSEGEGELVFLIFAMTFGCFHLHTINIIIPTVINTIIMIIISPKSLKLSLSFGIEILLTIFTGDMYMPSHSVSPLNI